VTALAPQKPRRTLPPTAGRHLVRALLGVGGLALVLVLAFNGLLAYVRTPSGTAWLVRLGLGAANEAIVGRVEAEHVTIRGSHVVVTGARLTDAEGMVVARVETVDAEIVFSALLLGHIEARSLHLTRPWFQVVLDEDGSNLDRTFAPRHPRPDDGGKPAPLTFIVHHLDIEQGQLEVHTEAGPPFLLRALALEGAGRYALRSQDFQLEVRGNGALDAPTPGPVTIALRGESRGSTFGAEVDIHAAGASVVGDVRRSATEVLDGRVTLDVAPNLARALVPGWPLRVPLALTAEAQHVDAGYRLSANAAAGRARLQLQADVDPKGPSVRTVHLKAEHLQLAELLGKGPETDLAFTLEGEGSGNTWASGQGKFELHVPRSRVRGADVGPVDVLARVQGGRLDVSSLRAALPGVELTGSGHGTQHALEATVHLAVGDLAALGRTLGDVVTLPPLGGHGTLTVELSGRPSHPGVKAQGHFESLAVGALKAQGLELELRLEDVARPLDANASLAFSLLSLSGRTLRDVHATLRSAARAVELRLTADGGVQLALAGTADADARGILLDTLDLEFPEERFGLKAPAAVRFDDKRVEVQRLELVSAAQSIAFSVRVAAGHLTAALEVAHLDLSHLPAAVVPASAGLAGILDATASAHGAEGHPDVTVEADLAGGAFHGLKDVSAHLEAARSGERLQVKAHLSALGSSLDVDGEGPELALSRRTHQPLRLTLKAEGVELSRVLCDVATAGYLASGCPRGAAVASGQAGLEATLDGFSDGPRVHLTVHGAGVRWHGLPSLDGSLSLDGDDTRPLTAKLDVKTLQGSADVEASLEATTLQLLTRRPSWAGWRTLGVKAALSVSGLELAPLHETGYVPRDAQGTVEVQATLHGTLAAPEGQAELKVHKLVLAPWPSGEVDLTLTAAKTLDARLTLASPAGEKGSVHLSVGAPLAELVAKSTPEELQGAALLVEGEMGPFELRELPLETNRLRRDRQLLDGQLHLSFEVKGTLLAPTATATLTATGFGPKDGAHVQGTAHFHSAQGKQELDAQLQSQSGGTLELDAHTELDLSLPAFRRGLHLSEAPLKARLHSVRFEPDFVASFLPSVRTIKGKLQVDGQAQGTLGTPQLQGSISLTDGEVGIVGYGVYQAIQLKASASNERFAIETLQAQVKGGTLSLQLKGERAAIGFSVAGALRTQDFPIVFDDQLWCVATLNVDLGGSARPWQLDLTKVNVSQAELQLPDARRKDLQDLNGPQDVILTRHGVPVDKAQALRVLSLDPRRRGAAVGKEGLAKTYFLRLALEAPNHVSVRSKDVTLELGLSKPFQVDLGQTVDIHGDVRILRGRGDVWGRRFEVQPGGQVRFGGLPQEAQLDVTGVYTSVQSQAKVYMHFSGEVTNVRVTPSSDPPMSESEIYTLLATGRTTLATSSIGSSTSVGGDAGASILGSWAATNLKKAVGVALPIDVLSVEVGNDDRVGNQTRLEAGKYVTDDIYIGYQARINADPFRYQNSNAIRVEYRFLRRWSLQLEYGDANAGSLDAVWSRDY
jgi:translocation and assembly module TamB